MPKRVLQPNIIRGTNRENQVKSGHKLKLIPGQIKFIEKSSVLQSNSIVWKILWAGRITASNVHEILHNDQNNPAKSLIKKLCTEGKNLNRVPAIKWGPENDSNSLKAYQKMLEKNHCDVVIEKCGLRMHEKYHFLGASPDGLVTCFCHERSLLEIKCPAKHKDNLSISDCIATDKKFCLDKIFCWNRHINIMHKYKCKCIYMD